MSCSDALPLTQEARIGNLKKMLRNSGRLHVTEKLSEIKMSGWRYSRSVKSRCHLIASAWCQDLEIKLPPCDNCSSEVSLNILCFQLNSCRISNLQSREMSFALNRISVLIENANIFHRWRCRLNIKTISWCYVCNVMFSTSPRSQQRVLVTWL